MEPRSPQDCPDMGTQRVFFHRRKSHANRQVLIIHFGGVLGSIELVRRNQYADLEDVSQTICLRHDVAEGMQDLSLHFQVVLYSHYSEKLTEQLVTQLIDQRPEIVLDAAYCPSSDDQDQSAPVCYN